MLGCCLEDGRGKELGQAFLQLIVTLSRTNTKEYPLEQLWRMDEYKVTIYLIWHIRIGRIIKFKMN